MAEKSFGVKEVNLIGASGTPTITSPNNLNLNAVNVAISTNVSIGGTLSVSGGISIGGTLTYEDVTNIDSVGLITARSGVITPNVDVDDFITVGSNIQLGNAGIITATTFSGSAASLTSVPAANITGTLPAISGANLTGITITPTNSDIQGMWTVGGSASGYTFTGPGQDGSEQNPDIFLVRGQRYRFVNSLTSGHPFAFRNFDNNADYTDGITGSQSGTQDFNVQHDAPSALKYRCTIHTTSMLGNIYIIGGKRGILTSDTTPSGASVSYDGIPSWATKITFVFHQFYLSGSNQTLVQLRNNAGNITSGYHSNSLDQSNGAVTYWSTDGFILATNNSGHRYAGKVEINKIADLKWISNHTINKNNAAGSNTTIRNGNGMVTISGTAPTGITVKSSGTDTFDSNSKFSIYYE